MSEREALLADRLGYRFVDSSLLDEALAHGSLTPEERPGAPFGYQRLEFLGDRVLGLVIADLLLSRHQGEGEGPIARRYAALVRKEMLADIAAELGLGAAVRLSHAEEESGGRDNPAILADVCEAVLGAIYLDGGFAAARAVIERLWQPCLELDRAPPQDPKTALQEWAQARALGLPDYEIVGRKGPPHAPIFTIEVRVAGGRSARGEGSTKRIAEKRAAAALMAEIEDG